MRPFNWRGFTALTIKAARGKSNFSLPSKISHLLRMAFTKKNEGEYRCGSIIYLKLKNCLILRIKSRQKSKFFFFIQTGVKHKRKINSTENLGCKAVNYILICWNCCFKISETDGGIYGRKIVLLNMKWFLRLQFPCTLK